MLYVKDMSRSKEALAMSRHGLCGQLRNDQYRGLPKLFKPELQKFPMIERENLGGNISALG
jgi:hypothetical protein